MMGNTEKLFKIIAEMFNVPIDTIGIDIGQSDIESWDSLGMINLILALEQMFEIKFDIIEIAEIDTVVLIKDALSSKGVDFN